MSPLSPLDEEILEALADFATDQEAAAVALKQRILKALKVETISEQPFLDLTWERREGARIGAYELTSKQANNNNDKFNRCMNILKQNEAAINKRFHEEGWQFGYWLYVENPDVIYRQRLQKK